jgi:cytochrome b subunit of formate dehydrogenase
MNEFVSIEILGTIAGCSAIITLLTQVFKKYLPEKLDTKWLALLFSVIIGVLRIVYVGQFDFAGITSGIINIFVLLSISVGIYEIGGTTLEKIKNLIGGTSNEK